MENIISPWAKQVHESLKALIPSYAAKVLQSCNLWNFVYLVPFGLIKFSSIGAIKVMQ